MAKKAKDPAFLFYTSDFLTGTMFMTNEQVGLYIRLMCAQHQHGGLIDKLSFNNMVKDDAVVRSKFIETEDGFYNERLMQEMVLRQKKSTNLSANAQKRWAKATLGDANACANASATDMELNMPTEDEDEDVNLVDINKGGVGEISPPRYIDQFKSQPKFKVEHIRELPKQTLWYENVIRSYKISPDDFNRLVDEFISHCHSQGKDEDKTERDLKSHFTNWLGVKQKNGELKPKPKQQYKKFNFE